MNNGFKENFEWITLISVTFVFGFYFLTVIPPAGSDISIGHVAFFAVLVALLAVIHIVGAILLIALDRFREPETDERDRIIQLKARRNVSWVLSLGIFGGIAAAFFSPGNFWVLHTLLATLAIAQIVESGTVVFHYRRGS